MTRLKTEETEVDLQKEVDKLKEELKKKSFAAASPPTKLSPAIKHPVNGIVPKISSLASNNELTIIINEFREELTELFKLAPTSIQIMEKIKVEEKSLELMTKIENLYREKTKVDWKARSLNLNGSSAFHNTPTDTIIINLKAPVLVMSPLRNDSPISNPDKDFTFKVFAIKANVVLSRDNFADYERLGSRL